MSSKAGRGIKKGMTLAVIGAMAVGLGATGHMPDGRATPTGLDVPRWITLKSNRVRARFGPGLDHRILWEYRAAGLPVQVIAETREWRKICDPDGAVAWIHRSVASSHLSVFNPSASEAPVLARPRAGAQMRARLSGRSIMSLEECDGDWCRVRAGKVRGWIARDQVVGGEETARCDAASPAGPPRGRTR